MAFVKIILLPLSVIYGVVTGVRNFLFHIGQKECKKKMHRDNAH